MDSDVRKDLAVDFNARELQPVDESAVTQAVETCRRVDPCDPQRSELALALTPIAIRVLAGLDDRLLRYPKYFAARAVVAFGLATCLTGRGRRGK